MSGATLPPELPAEATGRPVFAQPWHATAFGLVVTLHRSDVFTWPEWVAAYARRDRLSPDREDEPVEDGYYRRVVETLQDILAASGAVPPEALAEMEEAWRRAYLATPHGQPVELENGTVGAACGTAHHHHHDHHHHEHSGRSRARPVAVAPAGA
jgi:nitrile hydratase accessory protein